MKLFYIDCDDDNFPREIKLFKNRHTAWDNFFKNNYDLKVYSVDTDKVIFRISVETVIKKCFFSNLAIKRYFKISTEIMEELTPEEASCCWKLCNLNNDRRTYLEVCQFFPYHFPIEKIHTDWGIFTVKEFSVNDNASVLKKKIKN